MIRLIFPALLLMITIVGQAQDSPPFRNKNLSVDERISSLLGSLSLEEKISLLGYQSKAVSRLNIPAYNWWNEALHGVARAGKATIFPQAIGMAASFDPDLLGEAAGAISTEARAKYNLGVKLNRHLQYMGLSFWSPNINIFRDPRWGRGQETYGEDPFLTATMGVAYVHGLQGDDSLHLKASACAKHFAVHSGPEKGRHEFNAVVNERDLRDTYLYAFEKLVDAGVESVMCAYNRVNGEPCCTGNTLIRNILLNEWKFKGHVLTDCGALNDIYSRHKVLPDAKSVAAAAVKTGVSLDCGNVLQDHVMEAVQQKLLTEEDINKALKPTLRTQMKLGFFDDPAGSQYVNYGADSIANAWHISLARKMARESMVLLKNKNGILPLDQSKYPAIMIVGPNATSLDVLAGSYHGVSDKAVNFVEGITAAVDPATRVEYDMGCDYNDTVRFGGIWAAGNADITIAILGLTPVYEGEEGDAFLATHGADRRDLGLPQAHIAYLKALRKATKTPIVLVINSGSAVDVSAVEPYADAVLLAWYPGQEGGNAMADILFGKVSPSGKLPVTFYRSLNDLPSYTDYSMKGRTYRYFKGEVQYPFGFGLSYTHFDYAWLEKPVMINDSLRFSIRVRNSGKFDGDEVVQAYVHYPSGDDLPIQELKAFRRMPLRMNQETTVKFSIPLSDLQKWDSARHTWKSYPGEYRIVLGSNSMDARLSAPVKLGRLNSRK